MFWSYVQYRSMKRFGLAKPILLIFFIVLFGCLVAGIIYAGEVFRAVNKQQEVHHVQQRANQ